MIRTKEQALKLAEEDKRHETSMTIFYSRNTGKIEDAIGGVQDFTVYGKDILDKKSYLVRAVLPRNNFIIENFWDYRVNLVDNIIEAKPVETPRMSMSITPIMEDV